MKNHTWIDLNEQYELYEQYKYFKYLTYTNDKCLKICTICKLVKITTVTDMDMYVLNGLFMNKEEDINCNNLLIKQIIL